MGLSDSVITLKHDVRNPLPFGNETFDACFGNSGFVFKRSSSSSILFLKMFSSDFSFPPTLYLANHLLLLLFLIFSGKPYFLLNLI